MSDFKILFPSDWQPWLLFLLIPAIGLALLPYLRMSKRYRRNRNRVTSLVLHLVVMVLSVFIFTGMTFAYSVPNNESELIVLVDASYSGHDDAEAKDEYVQAVLDECTADIKLGVVKFGYNQVYASTLKHNNKSAFTDYLEADGVDDTATDIASALEYASGLFSKPEASKIVLISDGIETDRQALSVVKEIASRGIRIDTLHVPNRTNNEFQAVGVTLPEKTPIPGAEFHITLSLRSNYGGQGQTMRVTVFDNEEQASVREFTVQRGAFTVDLTHTFDTPDLHQLRFEITAEGDTETYNNTLYSYAYLQVFDNVLIIEGYSGESDSIRDMLQNDFTITVKSIEDDAEDMPKSILELCDYHQVIMCNVSNEDLQKIPPNADGETFDQLLYSYVHEQGGSMFTVGGRNDSDGQGGEVAHAYNREDLYDTLYHNMLPVQVVKYKPPVALMFIIDNSGSMGSGERSLLEQCCIGAQAIVDGLTTGDYCGVMTLSDTPIEYQSIIPLSLRHEITDAINEIKNNDAGGGTVFTNSIEAAGAALSTVGNNVARKHIILLTDGEPSDGLEDFGSKITSNLQKGITMSIVGFNMGDDTQKTMRAIVEGDSGFNYGGSGGELYCVNNPSEVGAVMTEDFNTFMLEGSTDAEPFVPRIYKRTPVTEGINDADVPELNGYYGVRARPETDTVLMGRYSPIYTEWDYGKGRVGSFMSDLSGIRSAAFIANTTGQTLVRNMVRSLLPTEDILPEEVRVEFKQDNYTTNMNLYASLAEEESITVEVVPRSDDAIAAYRTEAPLVINDSNDYSRFKYVVTCPGVYEVIVKLIGADGKPRYTRSLFRTFSYSEEYDEFPPEDALIGAAYLERLASSGGGTAVAEPYEVFAGFAKTVRRTFDPRLMFLIIAIVCFLLDIAVRKFKFKWIHEMIRDAKAKRALRANGG